MNDDGHSLPPIDLTNWLIGGIISVLTITFPMVCVMTERNLTKPEETVKINKQEKSALPSQT